MCCYVLCQKPCTCEGEASCQGTKVQPTLEAPCMSWMNSIGSNEQVVVTLEEAWGAATMTF